MGGADFNFLSEGGSRGVRVGRKSFWRKAAGVFLTVLVCGLGLRSPSPSSSRQLGGSFGILMNPISIIPNMPNKVALHENVCQRLLVNASASVVE